MKKITISLAFLALSFNLLAQPTTITWQGKLLDADGNAITQNNVAMTFAMFDASAGGNQLWPAFGVVAKVVNVLNGLYSIQLGTGTGDDIAFTAAMFNGKTPWLEVKVGTETLPRTEVTNVPFALISNELSAMGWENPGELGKTSPNTGKFTTMEAENLKATTGAGEGKTLISDDDGDATWELFSAKETDPKYAIDSSFINTGIRSWNNSLAKTIDENDTTYWGSNYWKLSGNNISNQNSGKVGIGSGITAPRAQLEVGAPDGILCTGAINSGTTSALGSGLRFHWYPKKGAFRVGMAESSWWNDDGSSNPNLALYSIAMGYYPRATGPASVAIGAYNKATADYALSLGSYCNASGSHSIAIGTQVFASGIYSMALGAGADTNEKDGAVVIGDDTWYQTAYATNDNQITMRFVGSTSHDDNIMNDGGTGSHKAYRFLTGYPDATNGAYMVHLGNGWSAYSSRDLKENFRDLEFESVLEKINKLYISEWNYKGSPELKYIGPIAEDFWDAFHLNGIDNKGINSVSADGVNMAAIKALIIRTNHMNEAIDQLQKQQSLIEELKQEVDELKKQVSTLTSK